MASPGPVPRGVPAGLRAAHDARDHARAAATAEAVAKAAAVQDLRDRTHARTGSGPGRGHPTPAGDARHAPNRALALAALVAALVVLAGGLAADQHAAHAADAAAALHLRVFEVAVAASDGAGTSARLSVGAAGAPPATVAATVTPAPDGHVVALNTLLRVTGTKEAFADSSTEFAFADPAVFQVLDAKYKIFVAGVATVTYRRFDYKFTMSELLSGTPATHDGSGISGNVLTGGLADFQQAGLAPHRLALPGTFPTDAFLNEFDTKIDDKTGVGDGGLRAMAMFWTQTGSYAFRDWRCSAASTARGRRTCAAASARPGR